MPESPQVKEFRRRQLQGRGKPIDSWVENSIRHIKVNEKVYQSPNWLCFEDFLFAFIEEKLTAEWAKSELQKPMATRHPVIQWFDRLAKARIEHANTTVPNAPSVCYFQLNGAIQGFLNLAYYMYLCEHHGMLEKRMIQRLQKENNFEGAMYELYVIASFLRAGFLIELEDETDSSGPHNEFTATHSETGRKFSVEAKARTLSSKRSGRGAAAPRVKDKLFEALKKSASHERIIFIELNRAEYAADGLPPEWLKQIEVDFGNAEKEFASQLENNPAAYVFLTNQSFMHWLDDAPKPPLLAATGHNIADFPASKKPATMEMVVQSRETHVELYDLLKSLGMMAVPSTFDDQTPEEYFGFIDRPVVGKTFLLPLQDGTSLMGELLEGQVVEQDQSLFGQFKTEKGVALGSFPLSKYEMTAYYRSPETFLGVFSKNPGKILDPYDCYEFLHRIHNQSDNEFLIGNLKTWYPVEELNALSHEQLVRLYCINVASLMWQNAHPEKVVPTSPQN